MVIESLKHEAVEVEDPEEDVLRTKIELQNKRQKVEREKQEKIQWEEEERKRRATRYANEARFKNVTYDHMGKMIQINRFNVDKLPPLPQIKYSVDQTAL